MWTVAIDTDMSELKVMDLVLQQCIVLRFLTKGDYLDFCYIDQAWSVVYGCFCQTLMLPITFELQELELLYFTCVYLEGRVFFQTYLNI